MANIFKFSSQQFDEEGLRDRSPDMYHRTTEWLGLEDHFFPALPL